MKKYPQLTSAPKPVGAYSPVVHCQDTFYFSGQIGFNAEQKLAPDLSSQLHQTLQNIDAMLVELKLSRTDIVKATIFMTDLKDFSQVNQAYEKFFTKPYPARSCVQVSALPKGALIEIEVIAHS
jgi:2-iminobutanoate/2-iminopropanoate deaminase